MRGLWLSGLRLGEALALTWTDEGSLHLRDLDGPAPMLAFRPADEKAGQYRVVPLTPDLAAWLRRVPAADRVGRVFPLANTLDVGVENVDAAGRIVRRIGAASGVVIDHAADGPQHPTAHDLRRSFCERWSHVLMPADLMVIARHESIATTIKFYVGRNAERTAEVLRNAWNSR